MVHAMSHVEPHICYSSIPVPVFSFFDRGLHGGKRFPEEAFVGILGDSAFAPTPMGNASIESCRVYDALENGAIPIVEKRRTLDYFRGMLGDHPLPTVRSWREARRLTEQLLKDPVRLNTLQKQCTDWWSAYQKRLSAEIGQFLEARSGTTDEIVPLRSFWPRVWGWQYFELIRHHSFPALLRRISRQFGRVIGRRQWREAARARR